MKRDLILRPHTPGVLPVPQVRNTRARLFLSDMGFFQWTSLLGDSPGAWLGHLSELYCCLRLFLPNCPSLFPFTGVIPALPFEDSLFLLLLLFPFLIYRHSSIFLRKPKMNHPFKRTLKIKMHLNCWNIPRIFELWKKIWIIPDVNHKNFSPKCDWYSKRWRNLGQLSYVWKETLSLWKSIT